MSGQQYSPDGDEMQRFSATGRPYQAPTTADKHAWAMQSATTSDTFGAGPANLLPTRYTDQSLIPVPVMLSNSGEQGQAPAKKKSFFTSRRRSENSNFTVKQIPRGEYLKHYAKDDDGNYIGTEEPAADCILRGADIEKYRGKKPLVYSHKIDDTNSSAVGSDGIIR